MLTFFRRIRNGLLDGGAISKYLLYAVGEIALVVFGILIALQINNWNEQQKENQFERKVLNEILVDTEEDLIEMANALEELDESQRSGTLLIDYFDRNMAYNDSMDFHFAKALRMWSLSPNSTAFEMAKSEGLHIIKNDSIRTMVAKINDYYFDYVRVLESRWQDYNTSIVLTYCLPLFDYYNFHKMKPISYEALKKDSTFHGILKTLGAMRKRYIDWLDIRYNILVELNKEIKNELY